tara:strand:+ start:383 stop:634 length:252 start_codon:yes stop_codon:yes gene_type:complete
MEETKLVEEILEIASELDRGDITFDEAQIKAETLVKIDRYEQLILSGVSQQRELLIAVINFINKNYLTKELDADMVADDFESN